ncbi:hypothetical protein QEV83_02935 [Methylocapsa sp. D3K7]|nr:hypothetical protein [Methylocapsa sp. D3K7]WGJ15270.1 hypothetical protein QEV83_02935 [Methylocapsa sp. D3K7]
MKKLILVPTILGFAAVVFTCQADARPGDCVRGAIVVGIVGHFVGHGGIGAAADCAYGVHRVNEITPGVVGINLCSLHTAMN